MTRNITVCNRGGVEGCRANLRWLCVCGVGLYEDNLDFITSPKLAWSPCTASRECTPHATCRNNRDVNTVAHSSAGEGGVLMGRQAREWNTLVSM
ncbi:hypothetical protein PoB_000978100 [Plakobranchus ocellatus]|uniref:Uncharacterized protein n=1 Tax=Plakobranchus ocellatus TaxID=259542 RepID=A0AAV3YLK0_9GAST|nr:hypothetical protein PoB_000978100 [Plakobranchus ocellatus]